MFTITNLAYIAVCHVTKTLINSHCDFYCVFRHLSVFISCTLVAICQLEFLYEYMDGYGTWLNIVQWLTFHSIHIDTQSAF